MYSKILCNLFYYTVNICKLKMCIWEGKKKGRCLIVSSTCVIDFRNFCIYGSYALGICFSGFNYL